MSVLVTGFVMRMRERAAKAQEEAIPRLEVPGGKLFRKSRLDEEVPGNLTVITVNSSIGVLKSPSTVGGAAQDTSREAYVALEDETPAGELPLI